jgi:homospermidine synthase
METTANRPLSDANPVLEDAELVYERHAAFSGRLLFVGFGVVGQAVLPLLLRHLDISPRQITIVTAAGGAEVAASYGVHFILESLTQEGYISTLAPLLDAGDFLLNVSTEVSSAELIRLCQRRGALYLDTCIEPWPGVYTNPALPPSERTSYALREGTLAMRDGAYNAPTAVVTHGVNPGLVSHFVKQALLNLAHDQGMKGVPSSREEWATIASRLGIKAIHIAERDTQISVTPKQRDEFVNTWSIEGFVAECSQPAELGWGSHERHFPEDAARHDFGCQSAIFLRRPGAVTRVRSWTPLEGAYLGFLNAHGESISIADYFTIGDGSRPQYRPTVHYAYFPCNDAVLSLHELAGKNWRLQSHHRMLLEEITDGVDELGVLLLGHSRGAYWYGSQLSITEARRAAPHNNATSLPVAAGILAGMIWAIENPRAGIVEPEDMDFRRILEICRPYLGNVIGVYSDWTPLVDRERLFTEELDVTDPWQFKNFRAY